MAYTELLNKIIDKSGLSLRDIAKRCTEYGVKISPSYISTLRNDQNNRAPSGDVSRAIAKACECEHTDILVIEAYLDTAPELIIKTLESVRDISITGSVSVLKNDYSAEVLEEAKKTLQNKPLSQFLLDLAEFDNVEFSKQLGAMNITTKYHDGGYDFTAQLKSAVGVEVKDNSMFPIIPKGSKVIFEDKEIQDYVNGDILLFSQKGSKEPLLRKVAFLNDEHSVVAMFPLNDEFETVTYSLDDVTIMGRVNQVIYEL